MTLNSGPGNGYRKLPIADPTRNVMWHAVLYIGSTHQDPRPVAAAMVGLKGAIAVL